MSNFNPVPKVTYRKRQPSKKKRGEFSKVVKQQVTEEQNGLCFLCKEPGEEFHHCFFKSSGGRGVYTNCLLLCASCHRIAHQSRKLADDLRSYMIRTHGENYYKDAYDKR